MPSRRAFLHLAALSPGLLMLPWSACGTPTRDGLTYGLFFDAERLPVLRRRFAENEAFASLRESLAAIDHAAERRFLETEVRYNDHLFDLRRIGVTAPNLAFYYAMTGDRASGELAVDFMRALMKFPKWDYFLEAGEHVVGIQRASSSVVAVSLCADWLGDLVEVEERRAWLTTMGERGCPACFLSIYGMRHPDQVVGWTMDETSTYFEHRPGDRVDLSNWPHILDRTNLKAVPASALAIGAVTYAQEFGPGEETARWLEQAIFSLRSFRDLYAPDGSYDENISYADYTSAHLAQATDVLQRFHHTDLFDTINWPGFVDFMVEMTLPTHDDPYAIVNFGDAGNGMRSAMPFWIARRTQDQRAQWFGHHLSREHDLWALIWYTPDVDAKTPPPHPHLWHSDLDWIVGRTGYAADDLVVAMRSGGPANHEHADRNSLIVKCFGEQLVADPYRPPYSFSDPAWMMRTTAGHSALLIDGQGHQYHDGSEGTNPSDATAFIVRHGEREGYLFWSSDATPAYQLALPDVQSVTRTVMILYTLPAILVIDKVAKRAEPSRVQARFFGYNLDGEGRLEARADGFRTMRPHAVLHGFAASRGPVTFTVDQLPIPEETAQKHPFAAVETQEARKDPLLITVLIPEKGAGGNVKAEIQQRDAATFEIDLRHGDRSARCRITDNGMLPEFEILSS